MCARTTCRSCGRPTWSGCGNHVDRALRGVPASERCRCRSMAKSAVAEAAAPRKSGGFLSRLFGTE